MHERDSSQRVLRGLVTAGDGGALLVAREDLERRELRDSGTTHPASCRICGTFAIAAGR